VNHEFWYLSRAAGFTAYILLFVSVALGIAMGTRMLKRVARRNTVFDVHRFTTILALAFTLFHVYILLGDGYFNFNVWQLSLPFMSPYRTWQTAVGVFSLYALVLLIVSFYVRQFIGYRGWRALHYLTFALFAGAALHGITAGTDTTETWAKAIYIASISGVVALVGYRIQYKVPDGGTVRTLRLASASATVIVAIVLTFGTGLLTAARDQTQATAAGSRAAGVQASAALVSGLQAHPFTPTFDEDFSGTFAQTRSGAESHLTIEGATSGDVNARLRVELVSSTVAPTPDAEETEQVADDESAESRPRTVVTTNNVQLLDMGSSDVLCAGSLTTLNNGLLRATCEGAGPYRGVRMTLASRISTGEDGTISGPLSGTMTRMD